MKNKTTSFIVGVVIALMCSNAFAYTLKTIQQVTDSDSAEGAQLASNDNGQTVLVWREKKGAETSANYAVYIKWYLADTDEWSTQRLMSSTVSSVDASRPQVQLNNSGVATIVWEQGGYIYYNTDTANADGSYTKGTPTKLSAAGYVASDFGMAMSDDTNQLAVIWSQTNPSDETMIQSVFSSAWTTREAVTSFDADPRVSHPQIVIDNEGNAYAVWQVQVAITSEISVYEVVTKRYDLDDSAWQDDADATNLLNFSGGSYCDPLPQIVLNSSGQLVAAWGQSTEAAETEYCDSLWYATRESAAAAWSGADSVYNEADTTGLDWSMAQFEIDIGNNSIATLLAGTQNRSDGASDWLVGSGTDLDYSAVYAFTFDDAYRPTLPNAYVVSGLSIDNDGSKRVVSSSLNALAGDGTQVGFFFGPFSTYPAYRESGDFINISDNIAGYVPTELLDIDTTLAANQSVITVWQDATADYEGLYVVAYVYYCGDGDEDTGEQCDSGSSNSDSSSCNLSCKTQVQAYVDADDDGYGSGELVWVQGTVISAGYSDVGTDCDDSDATVYPGATDVCGDTVDQDCSGADLACPEAVAVCGNGAPETGEACDDGNTNDGDGCSATCTIESTTPPTTYVCGNHTVEPGEECDDGNAVSGDGCSSTCLNEAATNEPPVVTAECGNGVVESGEVCDDGNTVDGDDCNNSCQTNPVPSTSGNSGGGGCSLNAQAAGYSINGMMGLIVALAGLRLRKNRC